MPTVGIGDWSCRSSLWGRDILTHQLHIWFGALLSSQKCIGLIPGTRGVHYNFPSSYWQFSFSQIQHSSTSLSIFYQYISADGSSELNNCMPIFLPEDVLNFLLLFIYMLSKLFFMQVHQHLHDFIPCAGKLRNSFPPSAFAPTHYLNFYKGKYQEISSTNFDPLQLSFIYRRSP